MRKRVFLYLAAAVGFLSGCVSTGSAPQKTQLQTREFQTRSYETRDFKMVMKAVMNTLQDDGFVVKQANVDIGLLTAQKEIDVENTGEAILMSLLGGSQARYKKNSIVESSSNISEFGDQVRVRVNFQTKVMDNRGGVMTVKPVEDAKYYQDFFSKVDKAIFLGKQKLQ